MATEKITLGGQELEIELRRITLICKAPDIPFDIQTPSRFMIDSLMTLAHTAKVIRLHPHTERFFKIVFQHWQGEVTPEAVRREGSGARHVLGLIDLSLICIDHDKPFGWRYPESYLHPALQCQLADVAIEMSKIDNSPKIDLVL